MKVKDLKTKYNTLEILECSYGHYLPERCYYGKLDGLKKLHPEWFVYSIADMDDTTSVIIGREGIGEGPTHYLRVPQDKK